MTESKFHLLPYGLVLPASAREARSDRHGERAYVPGMGVVGRWKVPSVFGNPVYGYSSIPDNPNDRDAYRVLHGPEDAMPRFDAMHERAVLSARPAKRFSRDVKREERGRFRAAYPSLPIPPELAPPPADAIFDRGECWRSTSSTDHRIWGIDWWSLIDRHGAGDFGHGRYDPAITDEDVWCEALRPVSVRNSIAIARGVGLVVSRYELPGLGRLRHPAEYAFKLGTSEPGFGTVEVTTRLVPERTTTLAAFVSQ